MRAINQVGRPPTRRAQEREARGRFILVAASGLLVGKRPGEISMDEIAAAAEYTRRTLYSYFKSRDDIWLRIHLEDMRYRWGAQQQALVGVETAPARITTWAETLYKHWKANPHAMKVEQYWDYKGIERDRVSPDIFSEFEAINSELAVELGVMFQGGIDEGSLRPELPVDACVSQFVYALRAVLGRALSSSYSFLDLDPDQYVQHHLDQYLRSICTRSWSHDA